MANAMMKKVKWLSKVTAIVIMPIMWCQGRSNIISINLGS